MAVVAVGGSCHRARWRSVELSRESRLARGGRGGGSLGRALWGTGCARDAPTASSEGRRLLRLESTLSRNERGGSGTEKLGDGGARNGRGGGATDWGGGEMEGEYYSSFMMFNDK